MEFQSEYGQILHDAHKIINGQRKIDYGKPEDSFNRIAAFWEIYLNAKLDNEEINITEKDVAMMMALLKISREISSFDRDSFVDCAGYIALAYDLKALKDD